MKTTIDVLCIGRTSYDLVFSVGHHPLPDEKTVASAYVGCGGGPAANAAVTVARLGCSVAFAGYLGSKDIFGEKHFLELEEADVNTALVRRGDVPTSLSAVLVKPDGKRALVHYTETHPVAPQHIDFTEWAPRVVLFDGHEPLLSRHVLQQIDRPKVSTILDAGSVHAGTRELATSVDYLVCSHKFARQYTGHEDAQQALAVLAGIASCVVITLGEQGLVWHKAGRRGRLPAFKIDPVDTTGAGDTFHGALAVALVKGMAWREALRYASAAAALCCCKMGARLGIPTGEEVVTFLRNAE